MTTAEEVRKAFHYLYPKELPALQGLARGFQTPVIAVNIGAGAGTSGLALLESRGDLFLYTIDIQDRSSPFGCLEGERVVLERAGLLGRGRNQQIHGDSVQVGRDWSNPGTVDLVFVDGDHSYEGCRGDIESWLPNIRPGGVIAIHDYRKELLEKTADGPHPQPWPGVTKAVDELLVGQFTCLLWIDSLIAFEV